MKNIIGLSEKNFSQQDHQFWVLQYAGWLGYAFFVFLAIVRPQFDDVNFDLSRQLINLFGETFIGFILSYFQWQLIKKIVHLPLKTTLFFSFISAALLGVFLNVIKLSLFKIIIYQQNWNSSWNMLEFGGWLLFSLTTMFVWTAIFFIMLYNIKLQKEHEMLLRAQTAAKDAQLQMLRYQLNPHFMFNTMNAISTLIFKNENDKANEMLDKLCEFFRYSLDEKNKGNTTLQKELELLELYLSIEKVRFGDRLEIDLAISTEVLKCKVPSMLLQPLVENAIKYAIELRKEGGVIRIKAKKDKDRLVIKVIDDGQENIEHTKEGFGIGISNTNARLNAMFNGDFEVMLSTNLNGGTTMCISIPFHR